jgi:hypothetical protein
MGGDEMLFLFGLGVVYAIAFRLVDNILVLWPFLTPLGAFFNNVQAGDIELPWASIAGFADILVVAIGALTAALYRPLFTEPATLQDPAAPDRELATTTTT